MLSIEIKLPNNVLMRGDGDAVVVDELLAAVEWGTQAVRMSVVELTPVGVAGVLRAGTQTEVTGTRVSDVTGRVFNPIAYAPPVEVGRKPGHWPPIDALVLWVRRKLGVDADDSRSVAFLVARKIAKKGTKGAFMFKTAIARNRRLVRERFNLAVANIARRLVDR